MQLAIGSLLRIGVLLAAAIVLTGAVVWLSGAARTDAAFGTFHGVAPGLTTVAGVVRDAARLRGEAIIQVGLVVLILTPVARVALSAVAFALERDRLYVALTLIVLAILLFGLTGHTL
ncbi:MAG TPA: DUF1634 domain-containing protein [Thermoleophilia bacterium]|nr:DUF1634 domain-containing protein [Thermoleophilia bacterium]